MRDLSALAEGVISIGMLIPRPVQVALSDRARLHDKCASLRARYAALETAEPRTTVATLDLPKPLAEDVWFMGLPEIQRPRWTRLATGTGKCSLLYAVSYWGWLWGSVRTVMTAPLLYLPLHLLPASFKRA